MKITTIGEILIDMTQSGLDENGVYHFAANPGGAPANVAVAAAKLGVETAFVGCIGEDAFGALLKETLIKHGVDIGGLQVTRRTNTTLAVVTVDERASAAFPSTASPARTPASTRPRPSKP